MTGKRIPYFRFYPSDFMRGVRGLTAQEVGVYTMLLCRMYEESGPIECHILRLSTYCGMREATFEKTLNKLVALGKINLANGMLSNDRAEIEISNRSNDLKIASAAGKASAEKRQQNQRAESTTVQHKANHTDTNTDTEDRDTNVSLVLFAPEPDQTEAAISKYNEAAKATGWPIVQRISPARKAALKARLKDCGGIDGWTDAIQKAVDSDFLCGRTDKSWMGFGFDWLTKSANFTKLMEGNYANRTGNNGGAAGGTANQGTRRAGIGSGTTDAFAAVAERLSRM